MTRYLDEFFKLNTSGAILDATVPLGKHGAKEITEAMAIIHCLRPFALQFPRRFSLLDLCAGNSLLSVIAAFLLPFKKVIAVDKAIRNPEKKSGILGYLFYQLNILRDNVADYLTQETELVITAIHPCAELALEVTGLVNTQIDKTACLIMMPCCVGEMPKAFLDQHTRLSKIDAWNAYLCSLLDKKLQPVLFTDECCLSPMNKIITACNIKYAALSRQGFQDNPDGD